VGAVEGEADLSNRAEVLIRHPGGDEVDSRDGRGAEPFLVVGRGRALDTANIGVLRKQCLDWFGDKGDSWGVWALWAPHGPGVPVGERPTEHVVTAHRRLRSSRSRIRLRTRAEAVPTWHKHGFRQPVAGSAYGFSTLATGC
jgi:hypothetical protein